MACAFGCSHLRLMVVPTSQVVLDESTSGAERARWLLPAGFLAIILLLVLVTTIGLVRMADINRQMADIVQLYNVKTDLLTTMYTTARERSVVLLRMVTLEDPFARDEEFMRFNELATTFAVTRLALGEMQLDEKEKEFFDTQRHYMETTIPLQDRVVELVGLDRITEAERVLLEQTIPAQDVVLLTVRDMLEYQRDKTREAFATAERYASTTSRLMTILALVAVVLSASIATFVIRKARRDERDLVAARDHLEERVADRTRELSSANADLQARETEIQEKNRTLETLSSQLAKYLSPQVYDSIFAGRQEVRLASKRRKLTIFFSDIVGFTELTDKIESEDLTQLLNNYLTEMAEIALAHGATIDKFIGDAMMAFFGDPESRGVREDALACVKMAIAMQHQVRQLNAGAVNLASRLEAAGEEGGVLISHDTWTLVRDEVRCEAMGPIQIRGQAYPVETYRVLGDGASEDGSETGHGEATPNLHLEIDTSVMDDAERAAAKRRLEAAIRALGK
jgi:class 3 adenylate cyclase